MTVHLQLLDSTDDAGRSLFMLTAPYRYRLGPGSTITVPHGFITNFGTIPRWFAWFISPAQLREAAIVHDYLCGESFAINHDALLESGYSRWVADAVLYEAMARIGYGWTTRFTVWCAVRIWAICTKQNTWPEQPERIEIE